MTFAETKPLAKSRAKPTFVEIGNRRVISTSKWNDDLIASHVIERGRDKWISIGELAGVAYGAKMKSNLDRARKHVSTLFPVVLQHGLVLAIKRNPSRRNQIDAVKIYTGGSQLEQERMIVQLEGMRKRRETTSSRYLRSMSIIQSMHPGHED